MTDDNDIKPTNGAEDSQSRAHPQASPSKLKFALPKRPKRRKREPVSSAVVGFAVSLVFIFALLVFAILQIPDRGIGSRRSLKSDRVRELALRYEESGLKRSAAEAWMEYLDRAILNSADRAALWLRVGKIREELHEYELALEAYYRSEAWYPDPELEHEIGMRVQRNLERLGSYAAVRRDLERRVGVDDQNGAGTVAAEIGPMKITVADLDRRIELLIADQLAAYEGIVPADDLNSQKQALFRQYANEDQRAALLRQIVAEELLIRYARESGIAEETTVKDRMFRVEQTMLAQSALQHEIADRVNITPADLENYYGANQSAYTVPERARIRRITAASRGEAEAIRQRAAAGESFDALAGSAGSEVSDWIEKGDAFPGIGDSAEAAAAIFSTPAGALCDDVVESESGFHVIEVAQREPARLRPLDEVRDELYQALYERKASDVREQLLQALEDEHSVVIHQGTLSAADEVEDGENQ